MLMVESLFLEQVVQWKQNLQDSSPETLVYIGDKRTYLIWCHQDNANLFTWRSRLDFPGSHDNIYLVHGKFLSKDSA